MNVIGELKTAVRGSRRREFISDGCPDLHCACPGKSLTAAQPAGV